MKRIMIPIIILASILLTFRSHAISPSHAFFDWPSNRKMFQSTCLPDSSVPVIKDYNYYRSRWISRRNTGWWLTGFGAGFIITGGIVAIQNLDIDLSYNNNNRPQKEDDTISMALTFLGIALAGTGIGLLIASAFSKSKARLKIQSQSLNAGIPHHAIGKMNSISLCIPFGK